MQIMQYNIHVNFYFYSYRIRGIFKSYNIYLYIIADFILYSGSYFLDFK